MDKRRRIPEILAVTITTLLMALVVVKMTVNTELDLFWVVSPLWGFAAIQLVLIAILAIFGMNE